MEDIKIWFLTDNEQGEKIAKAIKTLNLNVNLINGLKTRKINLIEEEINLFVFHFIKETPHKIINTIEKLGKGQNSLKYVFLKKKDINISSSLLHLEFISPKIDLKDFLLLVEKSVILERYREVLKYVSKEAESRLNIFESLISINRKKVFSPKKFNQIFSKIKDHEKFIFKEQDKLGKELTKFSSKVKDVVFEFNKKIDVDEVAADIRKKNLHDTKTIIADAIIDAQQSVLSFSANEVKKAELLKISAQKSLKETKKELKKVKAELKNK